MAKASAGQAAVADDQSARNFVQMIAGRAVVQCGEMKLGLAGDRGFSMSITPNLAGPFRALLTSTTVRLWLNGQEQRVTARAHVANLAIVEEGPQRIVLRAPFALNDQGGRPIANAQYDLVGYPEGELFVTLRVLPLVEGAIRAATELRFAGGALRFEKSYDLPLVCGSAESGQAIGLYWHNGDPPEMGVIGDQMRCLLSCLAESESAEPMISRSFVISLARHSEALRQRCLAHIQAIRPRTMQSCRPLVEQTPESREISGELRGWCYSFREGIYNLLVDGPQASVELDNLNDADRRIRVRFVARGCPAFNLSRDDLAPCDALQIVSLTPELGAAHGEQASAVMAAFDLPAYECMVVRAERSDRLFVQWGGARVTQNSITRLYRIVMSDPPASLGEIQIGDGAGPPGLEIRSLAAPSASSHTAVAVLSASPSATEALGRFTRLADVALVRNQPDRAVLHVETLNEARTASCRSDLVFRRVGGALAVHGYHTIEALEASRAVRATSVDLPSFRIGGGEKPAGDRPLRFFFVNSRKQIESCPRSDKARFGYEVGSFNRTVHSDFALCGFMGATSSGLAFLGRPLLGAGRMAANESAAELSMRLELPAGMQRGQRVESSWKMLIPGSGQTNLRALEVSLNSLKGNPVDLEWAANRFAVSDGRITHRVFELSPSGNPASDDGWCYLLDGGTELAVVGAGADSLRWPWLYRIRALGFDPGRLRKILLTDVQADHAGGARALKKLTGAAIYVHAGAIEALSVAGPEQDQRTDAPWRSPSGHFESVGVDRPLRENEKIAVGDLEVQFLHTPGPSGANGTYVANAGGVAVAFTGDLLFPENNREGPPGGRADAHSHGNLADWNRSIRNVRAEHVDMVAPAQTPPLSGTEAINAWCDRAMESLREIPRLDNIDHLLPRPLVARLAEKRTSAGQDDLWAVKEDDRPAFSRTRPLKIADGVWRVGGGFAGEYEDANVYLIDGGNELALIGAGSGLHTRAIIDRILELGKNPLDVKYILLPSSHWYEARGAGSLRAATQARVCAHRYEGGALWHGDTIRTGLMIGDFDFATFPPCRVDRLLEWGETLRVGNREILVLDAPGFHRGSTAFLMNIEGLRYLATGQAAVGDLPSSGGGMVEGATGWLDPHWGGCEAIWRQTIERFISLSPDVLLPGQGPIEDDDVDRQLEDCLTRFEELRTVPGATEIFPSVMFDTWVQPPRPDISVLTNSTAGR
jgi:glyoxylase-like metal-dependent hydrolase (beta-lactamase superfamily II)